MKHASEYSSEEWLNARDRRRMSRKEVANDSDTPSLKKASA
jgi:mannose-1-phosphate guanylyltransferase